MRRLVNGRLNVAFIQGKSKFALANQENCVISCKELEAARLGADLMLGVSRCLQYLDCRCQFWTDSQVTLKWIASPVLHLSRFVKRRVDKIFLVAPADAWNYIHSLVNPADMGTLKASAKNPNCYALWLGSPKFLLNGSLELEPSIPSTVVHKTTVSHKPRSKRYSHLDRLIASFPNLYALKKRDGYFIAFKHFFMTESKRIAFTKATLAATFLDTALINIVKYVQINFFGDAVDLLKADTPDAYESCLKSLANEAKNVKQLLRISELKSLCNFRPCVDASYLLCVERRLENADLPIDTKHPLILPSRHPLTRLIVIQEHVEAGMLDLPILS